MCAINGIVDTRGRSTDERVDDESLVLAMNAATAHRGPDGTKLWRDTFVTFGHNRLAVIDLSSAAEQPMVSPKGAVIVFNGEIYNFLALKEALRGYEFTSASDTEVILAAYEKWGTDAFAKLRGMFAFALWDPEVKSCYLVRDQSGIKPLFWRQSGGRVQFSSELKGVLADKSLPRTIDKDALKEYLRLRYVPEPRTLIKGVSKLSPGHYLRIRGGEVEIRAYAEVALTPVHRAAHEAARRTEKLIDEAVRMELVSDRPLGLFLSGGLDSTVVLDAAIKAKGHMVTYSLRFDVREDEQADKFNADADLAAQTAAHYGTSHHEVLFSEGDFIKLLPEAIYHLDEPIGNATALAQMHLARAARKDIVVALMGDGGDELFGGYPRYEISRLMDYYQRLPTFLRTLASFVPFARKLDAQPGIERVAQFMFEKDRLLTRAVVPEYISMAPAEAYERKYLLARKEADFAQLLMDADRRSWLVDEALARTDRMSMASALEARVPLLNFDLVQFASRLPSGVRRRKALLREAFKKRLPAHIVNEQKRGFFSPIAKWLRRPALQDISRQTLTKGFHPPTDALLNFDEVGKLFDAHIAGIAYAAPLLWSLVALRLWAKEYDAKL